MARTEVKGFGKYSMAFGVDKLPQTDAFVQIWDHEKHDAPCDEGEHFSNIEVYENTTTRGGVRLTAVDVVELAREHSITVDFMTVWTAFNRAHDS